MTGIPTEYDAAQTYDVKVTGTNLNGDKTVIGDWTVNGTTATLTITAEPMADCTFADTVVVTPTPKSQPVADGKITITYEVKVKEKDSNATVKAVFKNNKYVLYAYYGEKDEIILSEKEVLDAINATGYYDREAVELTRTPVDATSGPYTGGKYSNGTSFTIESSSSSSVAPAPLYKITINGGAAQYVYPNEVIKDKPAADAYYMDKTAKKESVTANMIAADKDAGTTTIPSGLNKDMDFVTALNIGKVADGTDAAFTGVTVYANSNAGSAVLTPATYSSSWTASNDYFPAGAKLGISFTNVSCANANVTLTINGVKYEKVADAKGVIADFETDPITAYAKGATAVDIKVEKEVLYTVTLDGKELGTNYKVSDAVNLGTLSAGVGVYPVTDNQGTLGTKLTVASAFGGVSEWTLVAASNTNSDKINTIDLVTGVEVDPTSITGTLGEFYKEYTDNKVVADSKFTTKTTILTGTDGKAVVYLEAKDVNTIIDKKTDVDSIVMEQLVAPNMTTKGLWKITLTQDLANTDIEAVLTLAVTADPVQVSTDPYDNSGTPVTGDVVLTGTKTGVKFDAKWIGAEASADGKSIGDEGERTTIDEITAGTDSNEIKVTLSSDRSAAVTTKTDYGMIRVTITMNTKSYGSVSLETEVNVTSKATATP